MREEHEVTRCTMCHSPSTIPILDAPVPGYRKCIVCGNQWRAQVTPRQGESNGETRRTMMHSKGCPK